MSQPGVDVWLATPDLAAAFDPHLLAENQHREWMAVRTLRRRMDWAASRSLLNAIPGIETRPYSLSHSHAYAAVAAVVPGSAVGVDIEWLKPRRFCGMAEVAFSPEEVAFVASVQDADGRMAAFYELWTLKEACAKAFGLHLLDALCSCRFIGPGLTWEAALPVDTPWSAALYAPRPQLRLAVVWTPAAEPRENLLVATHESGLIEVVEWPTVRTFASQAACLQPDGERRVLHVAPACD